MKSKFLLIITIVTLLSFPKVNFGQAPDLGATSSFVLFSAGGDFTNTVSSTIVTGNVGTYVGAFSAFPPGTLFGVKHVADPLSAQAAIDVLTAYGQLSAITCGPIIGTPFGNGQILTPNIYCLTTASELDGNLTLDGQGNCNALFIFKINGALSTGTNSRVLLINRAQSKNVYWQVNGAFTSGGGSVFRGTIVGDGAISLNTGDTLYGRGLTTAGAINLAAITATITENTWNGITSADWNTAANWNPGVVPSCILAINAVIPASTPNAPVINSTGNYADNLTIQPGAQLTINAGKDLTICGCTEINGSDALNLKSDNSGNASFIDNGITGAGTAEVQVYLSGGMWHYLCIPFSTMNAWTYLGLYMKHYSEPTHHFQYVIAPYADSTLNSNGLGYAMWATSNTTVNQTASILNTGSISIPVTATSYPSTLFMDGWNLIGNPYPSSINLNSSGITWTKIIASAWFWNPSGGNYLVYLTGGGGTHDSICPPEQSFFVACSDTANKPAAGSGTFLVTNAARMHSTEPLLKEGNDLPNLLMIKAEGNINSYYDELTVYFNEAITNQYKPGFDAKKLYGEVTAPQIYTTKAGYELTVNALPFSQSDIVVPMAFKESLAGSYTMAASGLESFQPNVSIKLEDLKNGITQDLRANPVYSFSHLSSNDPNRFVLHFNNPSFGVVEKNIDQAIQIYSYEDHLYIKSLDGDPLNGFIIMYDLPGNELFRHQLANTMLNRFTPNVVEGYYFVRIVTDAGTYNGKVYLKKS